VLINTVNLLYLINKVTLTIMNKHTMHNHNADMVSSQIDASQLDVISIFLYMYI